MKLILRLSRSEIYGQFYFIFGSFLALIFTFQLILSYKLQGICSLGLPFIWSWSHSKILTFDQFMGQNLSNLAHMPKYGYMIFANLDETLYTYLGDH